MIWFFPTELAWLFVSRRRNGCKCVGLLPGVDRLFLGERGTTYFFDLLFCAFVFCVTLLSSFTEDDVSVVRARFAGFLIAI